MEFRFSPNQKFQIEAMNAVTGLFKGQKRGGSELKFLPEFLSFGSTGNELNLSDVEILMNLRAVQESNGISPDSNLKLIEGKISAQEGEYTSKFYNFSIDMETGTGKTYVYIRTILELNRKYNWRKFIIVVPSIAVKEGVIKTLEMTKKHFSELFSNVPYRFYTYDSSKLSQIRGFAFSDSLEIMVMTLAAFNKASNIIHQTTDRFQGETPISLIQSTRPVLILDEPQNMESEKSIESLQLLNPLLALRYSATHLNPYNLIFRLTPFDAYRMGLVKRIEVASVLRKDDVTQPYIRLIGIEPGKKVIAARVTANKLLRDGTTTEKTIKLEPGDSLKELTGRIEYDGFDVTEIDSINGTLQFSNNIEIKVGEEIGGHKESLFEAQIKYTIEEHFQKQAKLKPYGIKVLSLFFIDRVANYCNKDGIIRTIFDKYFNEIKASYPEWKGKDSEEVQASYFASRKTRDGQMIFEDSKSGDSEKDQDAYNLIMKDKERLLSFDQPVAFIFSHSALKEGWDNPNIFQICTLNLTKSDIKKRQEVGRGVRLAVDQTGNRRFEEKVNVLTVVANENYESFVSQLQSEIALEYRGEIEARCGKKIGNLSDTERQRIEEEYGRGILPPRPVNANGRQSMKLRKAYTLMPEFQELWERIRCKTKYSIRIDSKKLVENVLNDLKGVEFRNPSITATKALLQLDEEKKAFEALKLSATRTIIDLTDLSNFPNVIGIIANQLENTTPPVRLTKKTILEIMRGLDNAGMKAAISNANDFAIVASSIIKSRLAEQITTGIQYIKISDFYEMSQLETEIPSWDQYLVPASKSIYDMVSYDSEIERKFVQALESRDDVRMYLKLPPWFTVPTPVGEYNPDWAIIMENRDSHGRPIQGPLLYLVRETKGTHNFDELYPDERRKIECGEKHFKVALGVDYKVVVSADELP